MGCINFFMQMNPDMISSYRETEQAIIQGRPAWATVAFFIAVFGGALGAGIDFGTGELIGIIFMPVAIAVFLIWYFKYTESEGWISS